MFTGHTHEQNRRPAEEQIEGQHDAATEQGFLVRPPSGRQLLRDQEGVGERQHAEGETRRKIDP